MRDRIPEVTAAAAATLELCGIGAGDRVAIWTDTARRGSLPEAFFTAAVLRDASPILLQGMETASTLLASPPDVALRVFRESALVVDLATQPWLYTKANADTLKAGVPILQVLLGADDIVRLPPRREIAKEAKRVATRLGKAKRIHITSRSGTDAVVRCGSRRFAYQAGFVEPPSHLYDSIGVSAITFYPERKAVDGVFVVDGPVSLYPTCFLPDEPIRIEVRDGRAVEITGGKDARRLAAWVASFRDPDSYHFAHTGFGLDPRASLSALTPVDAESLRGGVNVALGSSMFPQGGGDVVAKSHLDAILLDATFAVDDRVLVKDGQVRPLA
jgi:2,5-dihydroxypyridine 5,6-dioxygenase